MSTIKNHINTYATTTAYDNDLNKDYPNVSYIEEDDIVLFEKINYAQEYFAIESLEDNNTIMFRLFSERPGASSAKTISVSTDDGKTWANYTSTTGGATIATLNNGEKVLIKGNNSAYADTYGYNYFHTTRQFDVSGNIMSLIYGDNFKEKYSLPYGGYNFQNLLYQNTGLVNAENLVLPAKTLAKSCYSYMFSGCTSLVNAPELPATTLADSCYINMFQNTNVLPDTSNIDFTSQTVVASGGLIGLFGGTKVTDADLMRILPKNSNNKYCLPATTLANYCYSYMFNNCKNLTTAPELPATTLVKYCYQYMFYNCTNIKYIKAMFTTRPSGSSPNYYTENWVKGVSATGTFVKNSAASWNVTGANGIPTGWTIQNASS